MTATGDWIVRIENTQSGDSVDVDYDGEATAREQCRRLKMVFHRLQAPVEVAVFHDEDQR